MVGSACLSSDASSVDDGMYCEIIHEQCNVHIAGMKYKTFVFQYGSAYL